MKLWCCSKTDTLPNALDISGGSAVTAADRPPTAFKKSITEGAWCHEIQLPAAENIKVAVGVAYLELFYLLQPYIVIIIIITPVLL